MQNRSLSSTQRWTVARLAFWYLDRGRWQQAESLTRGLLALDAQDGLAWKYYGEARRQKGDLAEAARAYGEATRHLPDDVEVRVRLGDSLLRLGRVDEARQALEEARRCEVFDAMEQRIDALLRRCR